LADIIDILSNILDSISEWALSLNPILASLIISLVFNAIPYMTLPYLIIIAGYGASMTLEPHEKFLVAVAGGIGAALGKLIVFYMGRGVHRLLPRNTRENLEVFVNLFKRGVFVAVLLLAATPSPDDVLYVPLGIAGYNPLLFFIAVAIGKTVITGLAVFFGYVIREQLGYSADSTIVAAVLLLGSIVVTLIISRMNWRRLAIVYEKYGVVAASLEFVVQALFALAPTRFRRRVEEKTDSLLPKLALRQQE